MDNNNTYKPKHLKIAILFFVFLLLFFIFIMAMFRIVVKPRHIPTLHSQKKFTALRGSIYSADNYTLASSDKLYKASVHAGRIYEDKKDLFAKLFSIYSGLDKSIIRKKLNTNNYVFLSYNLNSKQARAIKTLSRRFLYEFHVFKGVKAHNKVIYQGIEVQENGEKRIYPYSDSFTPILGYVKNNNQDNFIRTLGVKGLENYYNEYLDFRVNGEMSGQKDINSFIIFNRDSILRRQMNGFDIVLNIPMDLQKKIELLLLKYKHKFKAQEVIASVMDSHSGKVLFLSSSNRFISGHIKESDYPNLNVKLIERVFEPGSVIKPFIASKLIEDKLINLKTVVSGYNGRFKLYNKVISDEHPQKYFSIAKAISKSSNIAMAQFGLKIDSKVLFDYLNLLGFGSPSGVDLPYEKTGVIPSSTQLDNDINKATLAYGYGISVNFMQLMRAYSIFSNDGVMVSPHIVDYLINHKREFLFSKTSVQQVISKDSANKVKKMLIKTVKSGTARAIKIEGLKIGAKTGTAQVSQKGIYAKKYISSVFGFAQDNNTSYTIGVTTFLPKNKYFASKTSAIVFRDIINILIKDNYLIQQSSKIK
jgi:cell division protein FtsI (penicillin-binding protein 3)